MVDTIEDLMPVEQGPQVDLDHFLKLCRNSVPAELQSGRFIPTVLVDTQSNPLSVNDQTVIVPVDTLSFIRLLNDKPEQAEEHLEGVYPVVILHSISFNTFDKAINRHEGLPAILQVLENSKYRFRLLGIKETGVFSRVLRGPEGGTQDINDLQLHFVLNDHIPTIENR